MRECFVTEDKGVVVNMSCSGKCGESAMLEAGWGGLELKGQIKLPKKLLLMTGGMKRELQELPRADMVVYLYPIFQVIVRSTVSIINRSLVARSNSNRAPVSERAS